MRSIPQIFEHAGLNVKSNIILEVEEPRAEAGAGHASETRAEILMGENSEPSVFFMDLNTFNNMKKISLLFIVSLFISGVFGERVSVNDGGSVTLHTHLTELQRDDVIEWRFNGTRIVRINKEINSDPVYDPDKRFTDRLKMNPQTGDLTITNITSEHTGQYQLEIINGKTIIKLFSVSVFGDEVKSVSVMEGDSVTLHTNLTHIQRDDLIQWKFGSEETRILRINRAANSVSVYDDVHDGMFRDRLQVDDQTGSLTITNITTQHSGLYQITITSKQKTSYRFNVTVYARLPVPVISRDSSQCSSSSSSSNCSVLCSVLNVSHDVSLSWYKGKSLLSSISVSDLNIRLSLPLEVEYQDNNTYRCVVNNPITNLTQHLNITHVCEPCSGSDLTFILIVVICCVVVGSLVIVAAVLIYRKHKNTHQEEADQTGEDEITYADPTFCKRQTHKPRAAVEDDVVYDAVKPL